MSGPPSLPSPLMPPAMLVRPSWGPRLMVVGIALVVFGVACTLPALTLDNGTVWSGGGTLLMGWMGLFFGQLAWFANFLLLVAVVLLLCRCFRISAVVSLLGLLLGLHTFSLAGQRIPLDEGGVNHAVITGIGPAAWVWLTTFAVLAAGAVVLSLTKKTGGTR